MSLNKNRRLMVEVADAEISGVVLTNPDVGPAVMVGKGMGLVGGRCAQLMEVGKYLSTAVVPDVTQIRN